MNSVHFLQAGKDCCVYISAPEIRTIISLTKVKLPVHLEAMVHCLLLVITCLCQMNSSQSVENEITLHLHLLLN